MVGFNEDEIIARLDECQRSVSAWRKCTPPPLRDQQIETLMQRRIHDLRQALVDRIMCP